MVLFLAQTLHTKAQPSLLQQRETQPLCPAGLPDPGGDSSRICPTGNGAWAEGPLPGEMKVLSSVGSNHHPGSGSWAGASVLVAQFHCHSCREFQPLLSSLTCSQFLPHTRPGSFPSRSFYKQGVCCPPHEEAKRIPVFTHTNTFLLSCVQGQPGAEPDLVTKR